MTERINRRVTCASVVGSTLAALGVRSVFGVVGSGNFVATDALVEAGATFVAARHENGAASMADAHWRTTGQLAVLSVHQGPGLTNALTGLGEAVKARVPLVVIAGATSAGALRSNFAVDQGGLAAAIGCGVEQIHRPDSVARDTARAHRRALDEERPVVLNMPLDVQSMVAPDEDRSTALQPDTRVLPAPDVLDDVAHRLLRARRPLIIGGQGAWRSAGGAESLVRLADVVGARLATTAPAKGMFDQSEWSVGIAGGFSTEVAVETLERADLIFAAGASLTTWTTRHDSIFNDGDVVIQVDRRMGGLGLNARVDIPVLGDVQATADALLQRVIGRRAASVFRDSAVAAAEMIGTADTSGGDRDPEWAHPGRLTARLDELVPAERTLVVDGGHFIGWPVRGLSVPDPSGFIFSGGGFQSIGLGMGCAVGAAVSRPDRLTVLAAGDGGFLMSISELETMVRLGLPVLVCVYNDAAYGAEVHHFEDHPSGLHLVRFPDTDLAALARGAGAEAATVRAVSDLDPIIPWLEQRERPLVLDMKIDPTLVGPWAEQDFQGH